MIALLSIISAIITIYTILCFVNILISWFPGVKFTKFGQIIGAITNPYLNFFSKRGWFRVGNIDFSPILSIGILTLISSILGGITATGRISVGGIIGSIIGMVWNLFGSILTIIFILVLVRWIVLKAKHGQTNMNSGWFQIDTLLQKFCYKVAKTFSRQNVYYEKALLINWIVFLVVIITGNILFSILTNLCYKLPV